MSRNLVAEINEGLSRATPVRLKYTRKAYWMIPELRRPRILDVGCGEGGPTLELAKLSGGEVVGLDNHQPSLDRLESRIEEAGLSGRVHVVKGSILNMDFPDESFDVIWSEGAIHVIGFKKGLEQWRRFVKPKGFVVVHEAVWPGPEPPREITNHWRGGHRHIGQAAEYADAIDSCGYELIGHLALPENLWWIEYFKPLKDRIRELRGKYVGDREAQAFLDSEEQAVDLFKKHPKWYCSAFFVVQKVL